MVSMFKKGLSLFSVLVLVLADILLVDRLFFYNSMLVVEPSLFKSITGKELESASVLANIVVSTYNGFIKSISFYPKLFLIAGILLLTACIFYEFYVIFEKLDKNKHYLIVKVLANSISFTIIVFYYNLLVVKSTKISNDVVANFLLFKVIIKKDIIEKKTIFFDRIAELIDQNNTLKLEDKIYLKSTFINEQNKNNFDWLSDEYLNACSSKSLFDTASKIGNNLIKDVISTYQVQSEIVPNGKGVLTKAGDVISTTGTFLLNHAGHIVVITVVVVGGCYLFSGYLNNHWSIQQLFGFNTRTAETAKKLNEAGEVAKQTSSAIQESVTELATKSNMLQETVNILDQRVINQELVATGLTNELRGVAAELARLASRLDRAEPIIDRTAQALAATISKINSL